MVTQDTTSAPTSRWRVMNITLALDEEHDAALLRSRACEAAGLDPGDVLGLEIARKSLDARRRSGGGRHFRFVIHADLTLASGKRSEAFERARRAGRVVERLPDAPLALPRSEIQFEGRRVAVVGAGPAGLFAALALARSGIAVDLVERGSAIRARGRALVGFLRSRIPNPESNLLFGEGGAGTYSDGKLYTRVDHPLVQTILAELVACGAPPEIRYDARAHIGTDRLHRILPTLRSAMESAGVRCHWDTRLEGLGIDDSSADRRVVSITTAEGEIPCDAVVLGLGHSARDSWERLEAQGVVVEPRATQIGVRIEHPQALVDHGRYGDGPEARALGPSYYNLTCKAGRGETGAYSFCMCPGGQIVASVSESGHLCTNGMSNSRHSSGWANAAIVTPVGPAEFGPGIFAGIDYQRRLESAFFEAGGRDYTAPAQRASDFIAGRRSTSLETTSYKFGTRNERIDRLLPEDVRDALRRALADFERKLPGFAGADGMLVGVETRCSSPIRVPRAPESLRGRGFANLYPVGEGAGHAGGILSAAVDGARAAHALLRCPQPM